MSSSPQQADAAERVRKVLVLAALSSFLVGIVMFAIGKPVVGWILLAVAVMELITSRVAPGQVARQGTVEERLADLDQRFATGELSAEDYHRARDRITDGR